MIDVVCAAGWLMPPSIWSSLPSLGERVRVHAIPQPGHGVAAPPPGFTTQDWADWLVEQAAQRGVERAVYAGHSMGGYVVQNVVARHPERVLGLILVGTTDQKFPAQVQQDFIDLADALMYGWGGPLTETVTNLLLGAGFVRDHPQWVSDWHRRVATEYNLGAIASLAPAISHHPDMREAMTQVRVPAIVVHGADDAAVPVEQGRELAARIPGAEFALIDGSGHCPPLERPDAFAAAVTPLLQRLVDSTVPA